MTANPFLEGVFAPMTRELTAFDLPVTGTIPPELDGRYLRNGPNPLGDVDPDSYTWFTGDGMVHGVRIRDGRAAWYRNRWVRSPRVARALGEPVRGKHHGFELIGANTNVMTYAGSTLALVEAGIPAYELTEELETVGVCDFDGTVPGGFTAHPLIDPATGEMHAVSYFFGWGNRVRYTVMGTDGRVRRSVDIPTTGQPMMHSFSLTEKYVIVYDLPVVFDAAEATRMFVPKALQLPARLALSAAIGRVPMPDPVTAAMGRIMPGNHRFPYRWNADYPARIGLLPREGTAADMRWFDVDQCAIFHPLNAYDDGDRVVIHAVRHDKVFDGDPRDPVEGRPTVDAWHLHVPTGTVSTVRIDDRCQEFPRIDDRFTGLPYRYAYAPAVDVGGDQKDTDTLFRHDLRDGSSIERHFGAGCAVGEFTFVATDPTAAEGEGILMGAVVNKAEGTGDLMLLDASTLETVASIRLPTAIPAGFHGNWAPTVA